MNTKIDQFGILATPRALMTSIGMPIQNTRSCGFGGKASSAMSSANLAKVDSAWPKQRSDQDASRSKLSRSSEVRATARIDMTCHPLTEVTELVLHGMQYALDLGPERGGLIRPAIRLFAQRFCSGLKMLPNPGEVTTVTRSDCPLFPCLSSTLTYNLVERKSARP